jgi:predicted  nucleic acid-binding Zn-ribbon protein
MAKKPVKVVEDLNEEVLPTEDSIETVELTIEEDTVVSDDEMSEEDEMEETEEDIDINSLEISMLKERMYDLEERVSDLEDTDDEEEEESDDDDSVI